MAGAPAAADAVQVTVHVVADTRDAVTEAGTYGSSESAVRLLPVEAVTEEKTERVTCTSAAHATRAATTATATLRRRRETAREARATASEKYARAPQRRLGRASSLLTSQASGDRKAVWSD